MNAKRKPVLFLLFLFFQTAFVSFCQDSEADVKSKAEKLFLAEDFVQATPLFLRLIALNPRSTEYNYKYGTCLLFNSQKKQDAFKYLNYSITDPAIAIDAYFYLGKAYHLNFQFNEAIKYYQMYLDKASGKVNPSYQVQHQIQMCQNGKRLLTTLSDLVVLEKKEIAEAEFFRLYNLSNIGGTLLVTSDFQSKIDKKKNHVPLIHFPANTNTVYYSSYGDVDKGNRDIYVKRKLPDGTWSLPQPVAGGVNTNFEEDFPYMAPGGNYLYFCSKGHNSMGGYDIFRSKFNPESNSFGPPENMDFAISSPDDDLFYVVDSLEQNAYFASSRQSQDGKIHVYKVRVDRLPIQLAIVKGSFNSTIRPDNKKCTIKVTDYASGQEIGTFKTNEKGSYLITFPKGGKYVYEMTVEGNSEVHRSTVNIPFLKDFKPLKQKIQEEINNGTEVVRVTDLFSEEVEDAQSIIAEIIRSKAELNVNANAFDLNKLDEQKENKKVLAAIGLENASNQEIITKFEALESKQSNRVTELQQMSNGSQQLLDQLANEVAELQKEVKREVNIANNESDVKRKNELILEAKEHVQEIEAKKTEIAFLKSFEDSIAKMLPTESKKLSELNTLRKEVQQATVEENYEQLKNVVSAKANLIKEVNADTMTSPVEHFLTKNEALGKQKDKIIEQNKGYETASKELKSEINQLKESLQSAKEKEKAGIQSKIDAKEQELKLVEEEKQKNESKVTALSEQQNEITNKVTFINQVQNTESGTPPNKAVLKSKLDEIHSNNNRTMEAYVKDQANKIDSNFVVNRTTETVAKESKDKVEALEKDYALAQEAVEKQAGLTPEDRESLKIKNNQQLERKLDQELQKVNEALASNPSDSQLKTQQETIQQKKTELIKEREKISEAKTVVAPLTSEEVLKSVDPIYSSKVIEAEKIKDEEARLNALNAVDNALVDDIDERLSNVFDSIVNDPLNKGLQQRKDGLTQLKQEKEAAIAGRANQLELLANTTEQNVNAINESSEMKRVLPNYEEQQKTIDAKEIPAVDRLKEKLALEEGALNQVNEELAVVQKSKQDAVTKKQIEVLQNVQESLRANVSELKEAIKNTPIAELPKDSIPETTTNEIETKVLPNYQKNLETITNSKQNETAKQQAFVKEEEAALSAIAKELIKVDKILEKNPEDQQAKAAKNELTQLQLVHEEKLAETKQNQLAAVKKSLTKEQVEQEVLPGYTATSAEEIGAMNATQLSGAKKQNDQLEQAAQKELASVNKQLAKKSTPELEVKKAHLEEILAQTKENNESIQGRNSALNATANNTVESLENKLGSDYNIVMTEQPTSLSDAQEVQEKLNALEKQLSAAIQEEEAKNPADEQVIGQLKNQLSEVRKRRGVIDVEIENMQSAPAVNTETPTIASLNNEIAALEQENMRLQEQKATATKAEVKQIDKQLAANNAKQQALENDKEKVASATLTNQMMEQQKELNAVPSNDPVKEIALQNLKATQNEQSSLKEKNEAISLAQEAQNYVTAQAQSNSGEVIQSEGALQQQKRRFSIEIGDLTQEIAEMRQKKAPDNEIKAKEEAKTVLERAVANIDAQLGQLEAEKKTSQANSTALGTKVTQEEEQKIASDPKYAALVKQQQAINQLVNRRNETVNALNTKRETYSTEKDPEQKEQLAKEIQQLTATLKATESEIAQKQSQMDQSIAAAGVSNSEQWKNVLIREVQPQQNTGGSLVEILKPQMNDGFEIKQGNETNAIKTITKAIPVGVKAPSGLVYRVQVGAFAKPIPENLFKEFTPVTGEKLDNGITRYLAGYFGDRKKVLDAQQQIRQLGYADAFVVAYCDGKRISLAEARRMEDEGLCKPMTMDSIVMEVIANTIAQLPADTVAKYKSEPKVSDYNKAPNAAPAIAIEEIQSLFYTVQIGVYNRPATAAELKFIDPVVTRRLDNGQIRYSTGTFRSVNEARPKRLEAVDKGIADAFITAYYRGERISLGEAERLLTTLGDTILFEESDLPKPASKLEFNTTVVRTEEVKVAPRPNYTLVSRDSFPIYPRKEINQLRVYGDFYYDAHSKQIRSVEASKVPVLIHAGLVFDTLVSYPQAADQPIEQKAREVVAVWEFDAVNGLVADWFLRMSLPHQVRISERTLEWVIACESEEQYNEIKLKCQRLGAKIR